MGSREEAERILEPLREETCWYETPAVMAAVIVSARKSGDRLLRRMVEEELEERWGIRLKWVRRKGGCPSPGVGGRCAEEE